MLTDSVFRVRSSDSIGEEVYTEMLLKNTTPYITTQVVVLSQTSKYSMVVVVCLFHLIFPPRSKLNFVQGLPQVNIHHKALCKCIFRIKAWTGYVYVQSCKFCL